MKDQYYRVCSSLIPLPLLHLRQIFFIEKNNPKTLRRRFSRIQRTCRATHEKRSSFLTLTFDEKNYSDWKTNKSRLESFLKNIRRLGIKQYIWVAEYGTETKRFHFHIILFNCPYIKKRKLRKWWKFGTSWIEECKDFGKLSFYLSKYISKVGGWRVPGRGYAISQYCLYPSRSLSFPVCGRSRWSMVHYYAHFFYKDFKYQYALWERQGLPFQGSLSELRKGKVVNLN